MRGLTADEVTVMTSVGEISHLRSVAEGLVLAGRARIDPQPDGTDLCTLTPAGRQAYQIHLALKASGISLD